MTMNCENGKAAASDSFLPIKVSLGLNSELWRYGIRETVYMDLSVEPHAVVLGSTGAGKTYALGVLLRKISAREDAALYIADYKGVDFPALCGCKRYYRHTAVGDALDRVYAALQNRMSQGADSGLSVKSSIVLVIDEWAAFICSLGRTEADLRRRQLASLLMLGRGVHIHCILSMQRGDAAYFEKSRDNLGHVLMLGALSKESLRMWCSSEEAEQIASRPSGRGRGYLKSGTLLTPIAIPAIKNSEKLFSEIRKALNRDF